MSEKRPEDMTPAERQDWAIRNMPLSDDPAPPPTRPPQRPAQRPRASRDSSRPPRGKPESPYLWIVTGYVLAVIAGGGALVVAQFEDAYVVLAFVLFIVAAAGAVAAIVGIITAGVRLGMRHARWEEATDRR